jgi:hypothetical protein
VRLSSPTKSPESIFFCASGGCSRTALAETVFRIRPSLSQPMVTHPIRNPSLARRYPDPSSFCRVRTVLVHRADRVGLEHRLDALAVGVGDREGGAAGPGVNQLGEPSGDQLSPLGSREGRTNGAQSGLLGWSYVFADRFGGPSPDWMRRRTLPARHANAGEPRQCRSLRTASLP